MAITFGQLYEGVLSLEKGVLQLERDIDNTPCDYATKCILQDELSNIRGQLDALLDMDMDFQRIDFGELVNKINDCLGCIEIEITQSLQFD